MIEVWRIGKARYRNSLWSGEGGLVVAGRWHSRGQRLVYTSESHALAQLESLVQFRCRQRLPVLIEASATLPDDLKIETVQESDLPAHWRAAAGYTATAAVGARWLQSRSSAVLKVPSALARGWNYLINPEHPAFVRIACGEPNSFRYDPRLRRSHIVK